ncbi:MAG: hypothetical protein HOK67_05065 [Deltaproteobacteria bacterium]|jgi:hypothetical protein|nr:hypothetical protein [Deltaproteobacteria bacterium]
MNYAKIDRVTGKVLMEKSFPSEPVRVFNEEHVWLPLVVLARPTVYDDMTQTLVQYRRTSEDISDLNIDVGENVQLVQGYDIVDLDPSKKQERKINKIKASDGDLARIIEDIVVVIATGGTLNRASFHPQVLAKINDRRVLRGEAPV